MLVHILDGFNSKWEGGKTWGLRLYVTGRDPGTAFTIQRGILKPLPPNPVGPNRDVLLKTDQKLSLEAEIETPEFHKQRSFKTPLLSMLTSVFTFLNDSQPNITADCWLCLNPQPPYYVGLGANGSITPGAPLYIQKLSEQESRTQCRWGHEPILTLGDLQGNGTCFASDSVKLNGSFLSPHCSSVIVASQSDSSYY